MQKQHKNWKKVEFSGKKRTAPSAEHLHLEKVHAGQMSHVHLHLHKDKHHHVHHHKA